MIKPEPVSISPWESSPSGPTSRDSSVKPKACASQSMAATPSSYDIIGITPQSILISFTPIQFVYLE
jgi:hypothetical protein